MTRDTDPFDALIYAVSHDLRAPLRVIDGFSKALDEDYGDKLDDAGREYLRHIRESAREMESMILGLLDLSRVSKAEMRRETVDITALAESIATQLKQKDPSRNVEFSVARGLALNGDPALLRLAFEHLLGNAWKFSGKKSSARIEVGSDGPLYVRDNGAGFDQTYAGRMFTPFQRFHSPSEFEGNGIGLAMVQRIVNRHGGRVWASGEVDKGATIYIDLK